MDQEEHSARQRFLDATLCLDLELPPDGRGPVEVGFAFRRQSWRKRAAGDQLGRFLDTACTAAGDARFLLGHNLLRHDLPILRRRAPQARIHRLPVVDTLFLSPLAFPENPYHRLVKGYKLLKQARNDPVADALLARGLFADEWKALAARERAMPGLLGLYRFSFDGAKAYLRDRGGIAMALGDIGGSVLGPGAAGSVFARLARGRACASALRDVLSGLDSDDRHVIAFAYAAAWLEVAGSNSIIPQWVWRELPEVAELIHRLRELPCNVESCAYCRDIHDPRVQLERFFGFGSFRPRPEAPDGGSLQERIVTHGMRGGSHLAILPTGGGKSLCFQLPALVRNSRRGSLTVVLSPLQALMRDQVENLRRKSPSAGAAALYGLLTPLERGQVLRRIAAGDVSILYVAPEQLRNRSFRSAVRQREIGAWVFDEAHCLSKWGHDFRPDYLYACRAIREIAAEQKQELPQIACMTATANADVVREINAQFHDELGVELEVFAGGVQRDNLSYSVEELQGGQKQQRVLELVRSQPEGSVIVYRATRARTETMAAMLRQDGLPAAHFHGGMNAADKKKTLARFLDLDDELRVIVATNAFGMGVDKPDVRLVVHADIPGTLENYLQEAGRAGRDQEPARCVLLFDETDVEEQFRLSKDGELRHRDLVQILRGLRRAGGRRGLRLGDEFHLTSGELLRDDEVDTGFGSERPDADSKVKTAVSWLERAQLVTRNLNQTRVFSCKAKLDSVAAAERCLEELRVEGLRRDMWLETFTAILCCGPDEGMSVDELAGLPAFARWREGQAEDTRPNERVSHLILDELRAMTDAGLVQAGTQLTAFVTGSGPRASRHLLDQVAEVERELLEVLAEAAPDAEEGGTQHLCLRRLNEALRAREIGAPHHVEILRRILESLSHDDCCLGRDVQLSLRTRGRDSYLVRLRGSFSELRARSRRRLVAAGLCLGVLMQKAQRKGGAGTQQLVEFSLEELVQAMAEDLRLRGELAPLEALERVLLYLHDQECILLQRGLAIFRSSMGLRLPPGAKGKRYRKEDYRPLGQHYQQRTVQVHVMQRYAKLGLNGTAAAGERSDAVRRFVEDYFTMDKRSFLARHFPGEADTIRRPLSAEAYHRIVGELENPVQQAIVTAPPGENQLVLAGPGSGKTRVVVHRCAFLLRALRVPRSSVLVLCFNRSTVLELRRRLRDLLGGELRGLGIHTYDGLAMRVAGRTLLDGRRQVLSDEDFEAIRNDACDLLEETGGDAAGGDDLRDRLLRGYSNILVDEYQDIDGSQYRLVSALAGRTRDRDARLAILAVGDDDQNIYSWRGSSVEFIRRFEEDYRAKRYELVENYRCSPNIIAAANRWIEQNERRSKREPIRVARKREREPGGEPVRVIRVGGRNQQDSVVADLLARWGGGASGGGSDWNGIAVLAREWSPLRSLRVRCRERAIPLRWAADERIHPWHLRETRRLCAELEARASQEGGQVVPRDIVRILAGIEQDCGASVWTAYLASLTRQFAEDSGRGRVPVQLVLGFLREAMLEERQLAMAERGVFLGTVHQAKGLEFDRVVLLDSGWRSPHEDTEALRRLFYVGMTRARQELVVTSLAERRRSFADVTGGMHLELVLEDATARIAEAPSDAAKCLDVIGLDELYLDYAGRKDGNQPIHAALRRLRPGSELKFRRDGSWALLVEPRSGQPVAALSRGAHEKWLRREILEVRVLAILARSSRHYEEAHRARCRVDAWELPVVEVLWTEASMPRGAPGGGESSSHSPHP